MNSGPWPRSLSNGATSRCFGSFWTSWAAPPLHPKPLWRVPLFVQYHFTILASTIFGIYCSLRCSSTQFFVLRHWIAIGIKLSVFQPRLNFIRVELSMTNYSITSNHGCMLCLSTILSRRVLHLFQIFLYRRKVRFTISRNNDPETENSPCGFREMVWKLQVGLTFNHYVSCSQAGTVRAHDYGYRPDLHRWKERV